jgi:hypothetical protein
MTKDSGQNGSKHSPHLQAYISAAVKSFWATSCVSVNLKANVSEIGSASIIMPVPDNGGGTYCLYIWLQGHMTL